MITARFPGPRPFGYSADMAAIHLIGVSIPRAGHHFLAELLRHALGTGLPTASSTAGRLLPVHPMPEGPGRPALPPEEPRSGSHASAISKRHIRDSVPRSGHERPFRPGTPCLSRRRGPRRRPGGVSNLARRKAAYYERFFEKWIRPPESNRISWTTTTWWTTRRGPRARPVRLRRRRRTGGDPGGVCGCVRRRGGVSAGSKSEFFRRRTLKESRFQDSNLLPVFESLVSTGSRSFARSGDSRA